MSRTAACFEDDDPVERPDSFLDLAENIDDDPDRLALSALRRDIVIRFAGSASTKAYIELMEG